jgi:hypothetical protein
MPAAPASPGQPNGSIPTFQAVAKSSQVGSWIVVGLLLLGGWGILDSLPSSQDEAPISQIADHGEAGYRGPTFSEGAVTLHFAWSYGGSRWTWDPVLPQEVYDHYRTKDRQSNLLLTDAGYMFDYGSFVTDPSDDELLGELAKKIREAGEGEGYSELELLNFALAFVQSIPYAYDDVTTAFNEYPRFPIETLADTGSDCEDTSILYASIVLLLGYSAVMLAPEGHMAVGVAATDLPGTYVEFQGSRYYYAETTGEGYEIGVAPEEYQGTSMRIFEVGSAAPPQQTGQPAPVPTHQTTAAPPAPASSPARHYIAQDKLIAIPAGSFYWQTFSITGSIQVDYSFANVDFSTENVGIILDSDLQTYRTGQSVNAWAYNSDVASATESVTLPQQTYDLVFYCLNEVYDCDLEYSLSSWY